MLLAALAVGVPVALAGEQHPTLHELEGQVMCPTCAVPLDQSDAPVAQRMKQYVRRRLAAGATAAQIKAELVDQFGPGVLAEPPKSGFDLLAWLVPLGVLVGGALGVGAIAWGWSRRRADGASVEAPLDPELERRLDAELRRFDA